MNKNISFLAFALFPLLVIGQALLIDKTDRTYIINEKKLSASKDTVCYTFNCINTSDKLFFETGGLTPFIFFKAYGEIKKKSLANRPIKFKSLEDYVTETVVPKLKADLYLRVNDLGTASRGPENVDVYDSLVIFDGKYYQLLTGIIEVNYYNLLDFEQIHPQQATSTIINTKAKLAPFKIVNGFPQIQVEEIDDYPKLYLTNKNGDDYTFNANPTFNKDDPFNFYREFVYRKGYGIVSFKGKYPYYVPMRAGMLGPPELFTSDSYYTFK